MSETEKTQKKSWFKGLQAELKRLFGRIRKHLQDRPRQLLLFP